MKTETVRKAQSGKRVGPGTPTYGEGNKMQGPQAAAANSFQGKNHARALEQVAKSLGEKLPSKSCKPVTQLVKEGVRVIAKRLVSSEQDSALIAVGRKIEQFEISAYTLLCAHAEEMEWTHETALLTSILETGETG